MDQQTRAKLIERNKRIIDDIVKKANVLCPQSIAMIGITGSFATGDFYEKSDLDLLIIINDNDGWKIAQCFILEDVAHDIYCHYWGQIEEMAEYKDPFVLKLLNVEFVYCADEKYIDKYMALRKKLEEKLALPLCTDDFEQLNKHLSYATEHYGKVMLSEDIGECRRQLYLMVYGLNFTLYMLNKEIVRHGTKNMPAEISGFEKLPEGYVELWQKLICCDNIDSIKAESGRLVKSVRALLDSEYRKLEPVKTITADDLSGSYEEIFSNWRNKLYKSAKNDDINLSFDSMAACQEIYDDFTNEFGVKRNDLLGEFSADDLYANAKAFDNAMEQHLKLYKQAGEKVKQFDSLDDFEKFYLDGIN